jgi:tol-pal system protein YbgF
MSTEVAPMRRLVLTLVAVAAALGSLAGSVEAGQRDREQMMADIRMLQEQSQELQLMIAGLNEALKTITARIDEQIGTTRKAFADQKLQVDTLSGDLRVVREKLDETNVRLTSLSQDVEGIREMIPPPGSYGPPPGPFDGASPGQPGEATGGATGGVDPATGTPPPPPPLAGGTGVSPRRLYEMAYADYTAGQWSLAIQGFETYLKTYPRSELADDAQYYIGESYAGDSKYKEAAAAYERVIREYPTSDILPEAWYKVGISYDRLGQPDRAREAFEFVVKNYPDSDAGRLAKQNLDRLNRRLR